MGLQRDRRDQRSSGSGFRHPPKAVAKDASLSLGIPNAAGRAIALALAIHPWNRRGSVSNGPRDQVDEPDCRFRSRWWLPSSDTSDGCFQLAPHRGYCVLGDADDFTEVAVIDSGVALEIRGD